MWIWKSKKLRVNFRWPLWFYWEKGGDDSTLIALGIVELLYRPDGNFAS